MKYKCYTFEIKGSREIYGQTTNAKEARSIKAMRGDLIIFISAVDEPISELPLLLQLKEDTCQASD